MPLTTIDFLVPTDQSSKVVISGSSSPLGVNVDAVEFDFSVVSGNASFKETVYREIDIMGTATIPEPSSLGLVALGGAALMLGRLRKL